MHLPNLNCWDVPFFFINYSILVLCLPLVKVLYQKVNISTLQNLSWMKNGGHVSPDREHESSLCTPVLYTSRLFTFLTFRTSPRLLNPGLLISWNQNSHLKYYPTRLPTLLIQEDHWLMSFARTLLPFTLKLTQIPISPNICLKWEQRPSKWFYCKRGFEAEWRSRGDWPLYYETDICDSAKWWWSHIGVFTSLLEDVWVKGYTYM